MSITVRTEIIFFLACIGVGITAAFLYDILRISRRLIGPKDGLVTLEDIIFIVACAFILFYAAYRRNNGELRLQSFVACAIGVSIYAFIVKNRFLNFGTFIIKWLINLAGKIIIILFFPFRILLKVFKKPVSIIIWYTGRSFKRAAKVFRYKQSRLSLKIKNTVLILRKK